MNNWYNIDIDTSSKQKEFIGVKMNELIKCNWHVLVLYAANTY
jgi:hypothetical protein